MSKKHRYDLLQDHRDWVEHAYNPGYWINRVTYFHITSWRWTRKHNRYSGLVGMIIWGLGVAAFVYPAVEEARVRGTSFISVMGEEATIPVAVFFILMVLASLALFVQKPIPESKERK